MLLKQALLQLYLMRRSVFLFESFLKVKLKESTSVKSAS